MPGVVENLRETDAGPEFLLDWGATRDRSYVRNAAAGSAVVHLLLIAGLIATPSQRVVPHEERPVPHRVTPLVDPPTQLTQRERNTVKPSKSINLDALRQPTPKVVPPPPPVVVKVQPKPTMAPPPAPPRVTAQLPKPNAEPPKIEPAAPPTDKTAGILNNITPPPVQTAQQPKLVLETPSAPKPAPAPAGSLAMPNSAIEQAVRNLSHGGGSSNTVGDLSSDIYSAPSRVPTPGPPRAGVQLKSDPMGVDFKPYLLEVLQAVRRNWFSVMPESARLGQRGQVVLIFGVSKDGRITKVVFSTESGARPLDRAAVAALSMSDPLPPLPTGYKGASVALQFTFQYNAPPH